MRVFKMREMLQKTQDKRSMVKHVHRFYIVEKQWKRGAVEWKNVFFLNQPYRRFQTCRHLYNVFAFAVAFSS